MIIEILLGVILLINITWVTIWYYRKTLTLSYRAKRFVGKEKVKPKKQAILVSEDTLIQLFLANGNEHYRKELSKDHNRHIVLEVFKEILNKDDDGKYYINSKARFMKEKSPPLPPIKDPRAQII